MEDNVAQTFNNALAAMCFTLKGEKERAERILDYFQAASVENNEAPRAQNFFYKGEARGFYQSVALSHAWPKFPAYHALDFQNDRWMGDMAWLFLAYHYYEKKYGDFERYARIKGLLGKLLNDYFKDLGDQGYVQHGWRSGDARLHENSGHHEGNIDAYAVFIAQGDTTKAAKIKKWLDTELGSRSGLPLDLYTWRAMAFGKEYEHVLKIPEATANGYKKTVRFRDKNVQGFFSAPAKEIQNIWTDGTAHMACAYYSVGQNRLGDLYTQELKKLLIDRGQSSGQVLRSLPYTLNQTGGYDWVDTNKGFTSCAVWYIFAKQRFNPLRME
jgi:hypothetical protein